MKRLQSILVFLIIFGLSCTARQSDEDGFIRIKSSNSLGNTVAKLEQALKDKGMTLFNKIEHSKGAEKAGLKLRPTVLMIFGNPAVGSKLMQCDQRMGFELPLKILIWEDAQGDVYLGYYDPQVYGDYYNLEDCEAVLSKVNKNMNNFAVTASE